jgi:hypothetical protein
MRFATFYSPYIFDLSITIKPKKPTKNQKFKIMKRNLFTLVLAFSLSALTFTGCSKNTEKPANNAGGGSGNGNGGGSTSSPKDKFIGSYKLAEVTLVAEGTTYDVLAEMPSCDQDNLYVLKADMTSAVVDAGEQCSPSAAETSTWSLPDNNTLVLSGTTFTIESMDGKTMKLSGEYSDDEVEGTLNITYVKQ